MAQALHMLMKPAGATCNMDCDYCFYAEKTALYPSKDQWRIADEMLKHFIRSYIAAQPGNNVNFLWQGGEPMLMGLPFFRKVVQLQQAYAGGKQIHNSIQTNGTLITEQWCTFFKMHHFLVGVSLDGPQKYHDTHRKLCGGQSSYPAVLNGIRLMQRSGVEFNITACVTHESMEVPLEVYHFFKELGAAYLQFAPIVERLPDESESADGLRHAQPDHHLEEAPAMHPGAVTPEGYGRFLCTIFDEWIRKDIGTVYVMNFEWALERWMGLPASYCIFGKQCGQALAVEHNGDVYACDHFVYPDYYLGNIAELAPADMLMQQERIGFSKKKGDLPRKCIQCAYRFACEGECPKNRIIPTEDGKRLNYLCQGYLDYFRHIDPYMKQMCQLIRAGKPAWAIKYML